VTGERQPRPRRPAGCWRVDDIATSEERRTLSFGPDVIIPDPNGIVSQSQLPRLSKSISTCQLCDEQLIALPAGRSLDFFAAE
jgi:hypothetical protein